MSTTTKRRLPVSATNLVLVGLLLGGALVTALGGHWGSAWFLLLVGLGGLGCALYARRPNARDITRVNAIEYRDERDRQIARAGFAVVGAAALAIGVLEFVAATVLAPEYSWIPGVQLMAFCVVWGVANSVAVRRG